MNPLYFDQRERVLSGDWTPELGVQVTSSDLPEPWLLALARLGHDLHVRQYGSSIVHIGWAAMYEPDGGFVWLESAVTVAGGAPGGLGGNGQGAHIDAGVEEVLVSMTDLVQTMVAEARTAWPWGEEGGFMSPQLVDGLAVWKDRNGSTTPVGQLTE